MRVEISSLCERELNENAEKFLLIYFFFFVCENDYHIFLWYHGDDCCLLTDSTGCLPYHFFFRLRKMKINLYFNCHTIYNFLHESTEKCHFTPLLCHILCCIFMLDTFFLRLDSICLVDESISFFLLLPSIDEGLSMRMIAREYQQQIMTYSNHILISAKHYKVQKLIGVNDLNISLKAMKNSCNTYGRDEMVVRQYQWDLIVKQLCNFGELVDLCCGDGS